jgi:hypothetical protein
MDDKSKKPARKKSALTEKVKVSQVKAVQLQAPTVASEKAPATPGISILPVLELIPQLVPFEERAAELEAMEKRAVIDSADAYTRGSDFETICANNWDQLEALRKAVKGPVDDYARLIQTIFVPKQSRFEAVRKLMNAKRLTYHQAEQKRLADEAAAQRQKNEEQMLKLAEQTAAAGDSKGADAILEAATAAPVPMAPIRIGGSNSFGLSSSTTKRWVGVVDKPFEVLAAIISGKFPIDMIEFKQSELNAAAKKLGVKGTFNGLKVDQTETLGNR